MRKFFIEHVYIVVVVLFVTAMALAMVNAKQAIDSVLVFSAKQNAVALSNALSTFREIYTKEVVSKLIGSDFSISHNFQANDKSIPLPASMTILIGDKIGHSDGSSASLYSPYPFPWRDTTLDTFNQQAWDYLQTNPDGEFYQLIVEDEQQYIRYAKADTMKASCLGCHNSHPDTPKSDWKVGDVRGVLEIKQPIQSIVDQGTIEVSKSNILLLSAILMGLLAILLVTLTSRNKIKELREAGLELEARNGRVRAVFLPRFTRFKISINNI